MQPDSASFLKIAKKQESTEILMIQKVRDTVELLCQNFILFSAIILTIWLPAELLTNYHRLYLIPPGLDEMEALMREVRIGNLIEAIFGPICAGALIHAVLTLKRGEPCGYKAAMSTGLKKWGKIFSARLLSGLYILLGIIALIVPGIILAIQYSLIDSVVVDENANANGARVRSILLTKGRRWKIFGAYLIFFLIFMLGAFLGGTLLALMGLESNFIANVFFGCLMNILLSLISLVATLFYLDAKQSEAESIL